MVGSQLGPEVDGVERLGHRHPAHGGVVGGERTLLEDRTREQVGRGHGHLEPGLVEGLAEALDDGLAFGGRRTPGHQVVVVEADAVGAEVGQPVDGVDGIEGRPGFVPERIAPGVSDRPEAEGEVVVRGGYKGSCHQGDSFGTRWLSETGVLSRRDYRPGPTDLIATAPYRRHGAAAQPRAAANRRRTSSDTGRVGHPGRGDVASPQVPGVGHVGRIRPGDDHGGLEGGPGRDDLPVGRDGHRSAGQCGQHLAVGGRAGPAAQQDQSTGAGGHSRLPEGVETLQQAAHHALEGGPGQRLAGDVVA